MTDYSASLAIYNQEYIIGHAQMRDIVCTILNADIWSIVMKYYFVLSWKRPLLCIVGCREHIYSSGYDNANYTTIVMDSRTYEHPDLLVCSICRDVMHHNSKLVYLSQLTIEAGNIVHRDCLINSVL
jgi:hypothetical protein